MPMLLENGVRALTYSTTLPQNELLYVASMDAMFSYVGTSVYGYPEEQLTKWRQEALESFAKGEEWNGYKLIS